MKVYVVAASLLLLVAGAASGQTLWVDPFNYGVSAGNLTAVSGGNWVNHSGTSGFVQYQTTSLTMTGYSFSSAGGAATISTSGVEDVNRSFAAQTGDVYMSALLNVSAANATGGYFLHFKDTANVFKARVYAQNSSGNLQFGLSSSSNAATFSATNFVLGQTYLLVLHYNVTSGLSELWILSAVPGSLGAPLLSDTVAPTLPLNSMSAVAIRQSVTAGPPITGTPAAVIDGIRVATSFAGLTLPVELTNFDVK